MFYVKPVILLSALLLSVFLFISSLFFSVYDLGFYQKEYIKYNIYSMFGSEKTINETKNLFDFFMGKSSLDSTYYSSDEISHLRDVKILMDMAFIVLIISLIGVISLSFYDYKSLKKLIKKLSSTFVISGLISLSLIILLIIIYLTVGFDFLFNYFHVIFFTGNYSFDPRVSNMKFMFPDEFFLDIGIKIVLDFILASLILMGIGLILRKKN
jgi:uncharacterized membrane protein